MKIKSVMVPTFLSVLDRMVKPRVSKVTVPITYECNQKCKTCGIWSTYLKNPGLKDKEITVSEIELFCRSNDILWIAFTGGEPFIRRDIGPILTHALRYCKMVSITTNGFNPAKIVTDVDNALFCSEGSHLALNVSMNGSKDIHDEISGVPGSFARARDTLRVLSEFKSLAHWGPRLSLGVSYTSSAYNKWEFNTYLREMADIGIGLENITFGMGQDSPSYYTGAKKGSAVSPGQDYIVDFSKRILSDLKVGADPLRWVSKKYLEGFTKGFQNGKSPKCVAVKYSLMLDPFWNVYPCMFYCPNRPCGNLRDVNFKIDELDLSGCQSIVDTCPGCWTPCESYSTIIFRPWRCL